ncbi:MAG TPA: DUF465 domain-containing protein [Nitrospirae bacterium]|nr:DUF465 domain-containing protein [Nitrospirota bacterium]
MREQEIMDVLRAENEEFRKLEQEHRALDMKLQQYEGKPYLTAEDEIQIKSIKKQKLARKDRMAELIRQYKRMALANN